MGQQPTAASRGFWEKAGGSFFRKHIHRHQADLPLIPFDRFETRSRWCSMSSIKSQHVCSFPGCHCAFRSWLPPGSHGPSRSMGRAWPGHTNGTAQDGQEHIHGVRPHHHLSFPTGSVWRSCGEGGCRDPPSKHGPFREGVAG